MEQYWHKGMPRSVEYERNGYLAQNDQITGDNRRKSSRKMIANWKKD